MNGRELGALLRGGWKFEEVQFQWLRGAVSDSAWCRWRVLWEMSAARFAGVAGRRQDSFRARAGMDALERRRERVRAIIASKVARYLPLLVLLLPLLLQGCMFWASGRPGGR